MTYPFDPTGQSPASLVVGETATVTAGNSLVMFANGPAFLDTLQISAIISSAGGLVRNAGDNVNLKLGYDYFPAYFFNAASRRCGKGVYYGIYLKDPKLVASLTLSYQTVGGVWTPTSGQLAQLAANTSANPLRDWWENSVTLTSSFPYVSLSFKTEYGSLLANEILIDPTTITSTGLTDNTAVVSPNSPVGVSDVVNALTNIASLLSNRNKQYSLFRFDYHIRHNRNPHFDTAADLGVGNVPNWATPNTGVAGNTWADALTFWQQNQAKSYFVTPYVLAQIKPYIQQTLYSASNTVYGSIVFNLNTNSINNSEYIHPTKVLTSKAVVDMMNTVGMPFRNLFVKPRQSWSHSVAIVYPAIANINGTVYTCNCFDDIVKAVETKTGAGYLHYDLEGRVIYFPSDVSVPTITIS